MTEPSDAGPNEISLLHLASVVLRRRYQILAWIIGTASVVVLFTLLTFQPTFTSRASFIPQSASGTAGAGGLQALAGQFGIRVAAEGGSESPEFYVSLLRSREILSNVLADTFTVTESTWRGDTRRHGTLLDLLDIEEESPAVRRFLGIRWLQDAVAAEAAIETGTVRLSVTTPWPRVSRRIAHRLIELVNDFNLRTRQSQAAEERRFTEERLAQARRELNQAEAELKVFLESNRAVGNSPELQFQRDRLQRQVSMRQQVLTNLAQAYEQARISEVRNIPLITVIEPPEIPVRRNPRGLILRGLIGLFLGTFLGLLVAFVREAMSHSRRHGDSGYLELKRAWASTRSDVRRLFRRSTADSA